MQRIHQSGAIRLAYREDAVPFSYLLDGKPAGYSIDLCLKVVDAVRSALRMPALKVEWVSVTSMTRFAAMVDGKADLECGTTTNTRQRREQVAFTIPHFIAGTRMLVRSDSAIAKWADLRGKTVVSTAGTTSLAMLRALVDTGRIVEARDDGQAFAMIESGQADAFVMDDVLLASQRTRARNPADYRITGSMLTVEPYAIMLPPHNDDFKKLVDKTLTAAINEQETQKLYRRWFQSPVPPLGIALDIAMSNLLRDSFHFPSDKVAD
ncbi:Glutamate/aspartate import solute-binding protein [Cupriavidus laharis]|uniref:Glutamate/aspartate import solute-binding protein n=2 Tax=Cupriavidus laharis TaxID=151654 RepID=A0ABN7YMP2_9BURK|nr:amino acid ABC transporter substrate-binding protein [Cupriavidus laharis]CAG9174752.1 Glutamate/aspartate import solute-binding protein [Cupriavidus laharis]